MRITFKVGQLRRTLETDDTKHLPEVISSVCLAIVEVLAVMRLRPASAEELPALVATSIVRDFFSQRAVDLGSISTTELPKNEPAADQPEEPPEPA